MFSFIRCQFDVLPGGCTVTQECHLVNYLGEEQMPQKYSDSKTATRTADQTAGILMAI